MTDRQRIDKLVRIQGKCFGSRWWYYQSDGWIRSAATRESARNSCYRAKGGLISRDLRAVIDAAPEPK